MTFASLKAMLAAKLQERKGLYVGIASFAAGAQGGPLAAKGVEYAGPYVIDALVKVLGG
jgi:hypothetical protein